jgi:hypothetical protein
MIEKEARFGVWKYETDDEGKATLLAEYARRHFGEEYMD